ncbi:MAG TPA: M15 family metallopeptidase, partial [Mycobacteriales bacterium]|nr:M15 family metallopeptidase [Mycobacteriales bacterium]
AGHGIATGTPPELADRRIVTVDELPPPADGAFHATVVPVPAAVAARSTWSARCPVPLAGLRYVTVTFRGFDGRAHTGELLAHRDATADLVTVFRRLFAAGYPIERMRITTVAERDAPPTGDGNTTGAFNCRPATGSSRWSEHAYGRAVDVNPFHNPYVAGGLVLPELATAYADRRKVRPGMITAGGPVVAAFRAVGWTWGGSWDSPKDHMHFTATGR